MGFARRIRKLGSVEVINDAMNFLINSDAFRNKEEAITAAIDFFIERYRNLCTLAVLYSLPIFGIKSREDSLALKKLYQTTENAFFDVLLRLSLEESLQYKSLF